jgi:hypothetical protein
MILVSSLYPFGPNRFQALHGASIRHSLKVLAVQVKVCLGSPSAKQGTVAPSNNIHAVYTVECRAITASHKVQLFQKIANVGPLVALCDAWVPCSILQPITSRPTSVRASEQQRRGWFTARASTNWVKSGQRSPSEPYRSPARNDSVPSQPLNA